jgi:hypothetical protein
MPKQAVRALILLRKQLDTLEADLAENYRRVGVESQNAIVELGLGVGDERVVKRLGENWRVIRQTDGVRVLPISVDEDI